MTALYNTSVIVCVCCVVCSMLSMLAPFGRTKKIINLILGFFLISSMIVPLVSLFTENKFSLSLHSSSPDSYYTDEKEYEKMVLKKTADNLVLATNDLLSAENIKPDNIMITLKKSDNNSIYISKINIYISKAYKNRAEDILKIITANMCIEPEIILNEENEY